MDKQPDETDKPEPSLFDGILGSVPQTPVPNPMLTAPPAGIPAPQRDSVSDPAAAALMASEPEVALRQPTPASPDHFTPPTHLPAEADVAAPLVTDASCQKSAVPTDPLTPVQPLDGSLGRPEPAQIAVAAAEVTSVPPTSRPTLRPRPATGAWWTIPMICVGLTMVACALIIGQVETNRQVAWQRNKLKIDLEYLQEQIRQNEESLKRMQTDPTMAEYLAQRQMNQVRAGSAILHVRGLPHQNDRNPFQLTTLPPPKPLAPYQPRGDLLTCLFADQQQALGAIGIGLMLVAAGLVLGGPDEPPEKQKAQ